MRGNATMSIPLKPFKWYRNLATRKGRLEAGAFIVEGDRAIRQLVTSQPDEIMEILTVDEPLSVYNNYQVRRITENQLLYICNTRTPQGTLAVIKQPADLYSDALPAQ